MQNDKNVNDPAVLRKMIAELEIENKKLKEDTARGTTSYGQSNQSFNTGSSQGSRAPVQDKDWMSFRNTPLERPQTASGQS